MKLNSVFMQGANNPAGFLRFISLLPKFIRLFFRLLFDGRVPAFPKLLFCATIAYAISPLDFIPEILFPIIGYTDDALLVILAAKKLLKDCPPDVLQEHVGEIEGKKA